MQDDERLTPVERELEAALSGLKPAGAVANRDRVMFLAGRASMHRRNRLWQGVSAFLVVALAASLVARSKPDMPPTEHGVVVATDNQVRSPSAASDTIQDNDPARVKAMRNYMRLRRAVLDRGVDALPNSTVSPASSSDAAATPRRQLEELLSAT